MRVARRRSVTQRVLSAVTEVRAGEVGTVLLLTLDVFLVLSAYYIIKPVREALILTGPQGPEYKSYSAAGVAVALLLAVPLYSRIANLFRRDRLVAGVTLFFAACLVLFYVLAILVGLDGRLAVPFYLWVGVFNMMMVAQFWAFANDIYGVEQGERLFALVGLGASIGAVVGSKAASILARPLGVYHLLLVSAAILVVSAALTLWIHAREQRGTGESPAADEHAGPAAPRPAQESRPSYMSMSRRGGFALVLSHRYLLLLAVFSLLFTLVNSNGEYMLSAVVTSAAPADGELAAGMTRELWVAQYYSGFYFHVNLLGLLLQGFAVSRLVRHGGVSLPFFLVPVIALGSAMMIFLFPALAVVSTGKKLENAADYSLNGTVRHMLWLPTSTEMKFKAKQAVDTFFVRMGDVGSAVLVFTGAALLGLPVRGFAFINALLVSAWLVIGAQIMRERREMARRPSSTLAAELAPRRPPPKDPPR